MLKYDIRPANRDEWEDAMSLAWLVFSKYEAAEYGEEGSKSFLDFISDNILFKMFLKGEYRLFVAVERLEESKNGIIGIISLRNVNHISLLFVNDAYHKKGIGKSLIEYVKMYLIEERGVHTCTVNAAPYALEFYRKQGFSDTGEKQESEGIVYTPMKAEF